MCHWSKYKLLTTPIFPQNSDKTREWAGVLLPKLLSLLFYYCSPQRPQLRPAISLKPVRVSASRMDRLMGGRRCLRASLRTRVHVRPQSKDCVRVVCFWITCVIYRRWSDSWMRSQAQGQPHTVCVINQIRKEIKILPLLLPWLRDTEDRTWNTVGDIYIWLCRHEFFLNFRYVDSCCFIQVHPSILKCPRFILEAPIKTI